MTSDSGITARHTVIEVDMQSLWTSVEARISAASSIKRILTKTWSQVEIFVPVILPTDRSLSRESEHEVLVHQVTETCPSLVASKYTACTFLRRVIL